jgi:peptide/nickel transport system permease protein
MGQSIVFKMPVLPLIVERVAPTLFLVFGSVLLTLAIAVPLASVAALKRGSALDHAIRGFTTAGLGFPAFWLGIMLIILFSAKLGLFPVSGYGDDWLERLHHLILPCLTVALALSAVMTRNLRASMIAELESDHATAARAKGLPESWVFRQHVLPNSLIPTINLLAINVGWLIGGSVVVETVFSLPGLGQLLVRAIFSRDYMVVQGVTLVFACATVAVNFIADLLTVAVDPRVKL